MASQLVQVRSCDGQCCRESPRFPTEDGSDCIYHVDNGCDVMRGVATIPNTQSLIFPEKTAQQVYEDTCLNWPQNTPLSAGYTGTGGCCWQWIDDGN